MTEWQAFAKLEPFGGLAEDVRAGIAPAAIVNANMVDGTPVMPLDFIPWQREDWGKPPPAPVPLPPTDDAQELAFRKIMGLAH